MTPDGIDVLLRLKGHLGMKVSATPLTPKLMHTPHSSAQSRTITVAAADGTDFSFVFCTPGCVHMQAFNKAEAVEINIAAQECCDIIQSVLAVGLEKALSGVRA